MGEKDFRVRKGLVVDGTSYSTVAGKLAVGLEEAGTPSASHSNILRVSGNTSNSGDSTLPSAQPQLIVKTQSNSQDALVRILGRRNGATTQNQAVLQLGNHDDNGTDNGGINYANLGAIAGRVSNSATNVGDMVFITYADGATPSDRMIIKSDGKVGIGTTSPQSLLDIRGAAGSPGKLTLSTDELTVADGDKLGRIDFNAPSEADGTDAVLVGASIWAEADATFDTSHNTTELVFATANTAAAAEQMRLTSDGKLGIGTATPSYDLHVVGDIYATDNLRVGNTSPNKITLNGNDAYVEGQFSAEGTAGSYLYSLALGGESVTTTSGQILGATATLSGSSAGDYEALKLVNTDDTNDAAVTVLHMSNLRQTDSAFFLEHDAFGNTKMFTGQGSSVATSAGSDMNLGITILEAGGVRISDAFQFPTSIGGAGQVLKVPSSGSVLEWANDDSSAGGASTLNGLTDVLVSNDSIFLNNFGSAPNTGTLGVGQQDNVAIGHNALDALTSGEYHVAIGSGAGGSVTADDSSVFIGKNAGLNSTPTAAVIIGKEAGESATTVDYSILLGATAGASSTGQHTIFAGWKAGKFAGADNGIGIGRMALQGSTTVGNNDGENNIAVGNEAMSSITGGASNIGVGESAAEGLTTGSSNIAIGRETMKGVHTGIDNNVALGYEAGYYIGNDDNVAIGYRALKGSSTASANSGSKNIAIGYTAMESYTTATDNVAIGRNALGDVTTGDNNIAIGEGALSTTDVAAANNIMMGYYAGSNLKGGVNVGIGSNAVRGSTTVSNNTGTYNVGIGNFTLSVLTSGDHNVAIGDTALQNVSSGNGNIGIGQDAGDSIADGSFNVLIGEDAGQDITSGDDNLIIHAGDNPANAPSSATANEQLQISSGRTWFQGYDGNLYLGRNHLQKIPSSGEDASGTALEIGGGAGTGQGAGGDLKLQYAPAAGSTNSNVNSHADALTVHGDTGNVTIHNNLIVSGDSITVNAETITTEEAMLSLGIGQTATDADALDFGFYGTYDVGDTQKFRGVFADASDSGKFKFFKDLQAEPTTTVNTAGTGYAAATVVAATFEGNLTGNATGSHSGTLAGNASTATTATNVVVSANNSANETVYPLFVDGATGTQGAETDTGLTYNPSTGMLTATGFTGALTGNADTATSATTAGGLSSTLAVSSGGTGATTLTSNAVLTGNGTSAVQAESNFTYDGNTLTVKGNDGVTALTDDPIVLVRPILTNSRDAAVKIQGARNGSTSANAATLLLSNEDDNLSDANQFNHLGAIVGRVSDITDNHGDMHFLTFSDGATANDTMTLAGTGNVGIGATAPVAPLEIKKSAYNSGGYKSHLLIVDQTAYDGTNNGGAILLGGKEDSGGNLAYWAKISGEKANTTADDRSGTLHFWTRKEGGNPTQRMIIDEDGNVGIGTTSPTHKLHLHDASRVDIKFSNDNDESHYIRKDGDYLRIRGEDDSTVLMEIRNNSSSNFVSFPSGNVGVGTNAPDQTLHVEGSILADAYNHATTTLASNYTDGATSMVLTDASEFPTAGSGTINGVAFTWTNKSSNTLTVPDLDASYTAGVTVVADTGLFFRDGFENVAQPSVTVYDKANSGASRDDLSLNANSGIRFRVGNESQMELTNDQLSLTTGNQGAAAIFGFRDRTDMGIKSNTSYSVGVMAPDNVFIQTDSNNNGNANYIDFGHGSSTVGSATSMMRIVMAGATGVGKVGIGTTSPNQPLTVEGSMSLKEQASANADTAAYGQLWVKSDSPNNLYFTNDAGTDIQITTSSGLNASGGGGAVSAVANGANNRIATFSSADALNGEAALTWDGGTLSITSEDTVTEAIKVTIADTDGTADSTPFVVDGNGRVGIGTASPLSDMALTLNGDGTSYEGIAFQVGGSTKWKFSSDSSSFYWDSQSSGMDITSPGNDSSPGTSMNKLQVNVGDADGVADFNDGILIVNNDASIADGDVIGGIGFDTRDGNVPSRTTEASAAIVALAAEAHGQQDKGGHLTFLTSAVDDDDDTASSERVRITSAGHLVVGATAITGTASHGIIEVANATQANVRVTDTNAGSTDFAQSGNDTYILNRHASGKIYIKPGNGDHSIELNSTGQVKFNNEYTFPTSDGSANQVLTTNGSGALSFADAGGSSGSDMKKFVAIQNTGTGDATTLINVNNTTAQAITWLSEVHKDSIFTHSTSSSPEEITVTSDGTYLIDYSINTENTGGNRFVGHARLYVNGTALNYTLATSYSRGNSFDDDMVAHWSGVVELSANDVVTVKMRKNDADDTSQVQVQQDGTYISLLKVGGQATNTFVIVGEESDDYITSEAAAGNANGFSFSYGNGAQNTTKSSSGSDFGVVIPAGCTLSRIDITFGNIGSETNSNNQTLTVFKNRSASTTTMTYNASGTGGNAFTKNFTSLSGNGLSYSAGDTFNLRATGLAGYTDTQVGPARMTAYFTVD